MRIDSEGDLSLSKIYRLVDANLNRLREGLRVLEDIERFIYDNQPLAERLKELRHACRIPEYEKYLQSRDIVGDVLKATTSSEANRENMRSIQISNIKRAQESARVLEESLKLIDPNLAESYKQIRYRLYDIEKAILL